MQSYPINLFAGGSQTFSTAARRFVYESGATDPIGGDARIIVKPDTGNEIVLRPGQAFGLAPGENAANWYVRPYNPTARISGIAIIGSGEFNDGTFKVDASTGTIAVRPEGGFKVVNTTDERVPVALDPATETALKEHPLMSYTHAKSVTTTYTGNIALVTAAENVRGVIIEASQIVQLGSNGGGARILAKDTAPTSLTDGDIVVPYLTNFGDTAPVVRRIKVAAGKGLWARSASNATTDISVLLTIL